MRKILPVAAARATREDEQESVPRAIRRTRRPGREPHTRPRNRKNTSPPDCARGSRGEGLRSRRRQENDVLHFLQKVVALPRGRPHGGTRDAFGPEHLGIRTSSPWYLPPAFGGHRAPEGVRRKKTDSLPRCERSPVEQLDNCHVSGPVAQRRAPGEYVRDGLVVQVHLGPPVEHLPQSNAGESVGEARQTRHNSQKAVLRGSRVAWDRELPSEHGCRLRGAHGYCGARPHRSTWSVRPMVGRRRYKPHMGVRASHALPLPHVAGRRREPHSRPQVDDCDPTRAGFRVGAGPGSARALGARERGFESHRCDLAITREKKERYYRRKVNA